MITYVDEVYEHGILRLMEDVPLQDGQKVRILLESVEPSMNLTTEEARHRLYAAGVLLESEEELAGEILTDDELDALVEQTAGGRNSLEMINEDRGDY
ncbi:MAG: hypothetical protein BroJett018_25800 [Chloroflexota bacterium]|nr:MAG: hypothetical protein BroJett018_25800 [Chloroflexota bacterium]